MRPVLLAVLILSLAGCGNGQPATEPAPQVSGLESSLTVPRPSTDLAVRLVGDGVDLPSRAVAFGDTLSDAQPLLRRFLGEPSKDTGTIETFGAYGTCPGKDLRVLEYAGGALQLLFGTLDGATQMTFYAYTLTGLQGDASTAPQARALIGDAATFDFGPGTTVTELQAGAGTTLELLPDEEPIGPAFRLTDQSGGFFGNLSSPTGIVNAVQAGEGCGE